MCVCVAWLVRALSAYLHCVMMRLTNSLQFAAPLLPQPCLSLSSCNSFPSFPQVLQIEQALQQDPRRLVVPAASPMHTGGVHHPYTPSFLQQRTRNRSNTSPNTRHGKASPPGMGGGGR